MPTVHARTVQRAAEIVGGLEALAAQLDVRDENLKKWLQGALQVPQEIFLRCADIVNAHQLKEISGPNTNASVRKGPG
jgi:DNA-binding transcriptional regulator YdaS (Cro superfamily)